METCGYISPISSKLLADYHDNEKFALKLDERLHGLCSKGHSHRWAGFTFSSYLYLSNVLIKHKIELIR